jgi:hypothetical protein
MTYTKPVVLAQNSVQGSYAAGCPPHSTTLTKASCKECERTS